MTTSLMLSARRLHWQSRLRFHGFTQQWKSFVAVFTGVLLSIAGVAIRPADAGELLPVSVAEPLDLTQSWARVTASPGGASSIVDIQIYVHSRNLKEYVEVFTPLSDVAVSAISPTLAAAADTGAVGLAPAPTDVNPGRVESRIWVNQTDRLGKLVGFAEAERRANNQVRRLKRRGIESTVRVVTSPWVALYSIANDGTIQSRDAETGTPLWTNRVGDRSLPYGKLGINDSYLTVINGTTLIQIDIVNGQVIQEIKLLRPSLFGAINTGPYAMVTGVSGTVDSYPLLDLDRDPPIATFTGRALAAPVRAPGSERVAWGTNAGFVYGMELSGKPTIQFRLETDGIVSGRLATTSGDRFFFGTDRGQVYGIQATKRGKVLWTFPFGEPFVDQPLVIGEQMLIRSAYGNLFSLATLNGEPTWSSPVAGVADLYGVLGQYIFARTSRGALAVLDRDSGTPIGVYRNVEPLRVVRNTLTDRIYFMDSRGTVQCLRPKDSELPVIMLDVPAPAENPADSEANTSPGANAETGNPFETGGGSDPFDAGDDDPFGGDGGNDPFGGGNDPFGGGDDPFGGSDDPFGS